MVHRARRLISENLKAERLKRINRLIDTPEAAEDFLVFAPLELHGLYALRLLAAAATEAETGVTVMPVGGKKFGGEPASVKVCVIGLPRAAPFTSSAVATTVPAPGATLVEKAHGVGVSTPVSRTAGCAVPDESVTTTEVEANAAPVGVGVEGPTAMATMTGTRVALIGRLLFGDRRDCSA
jgi:hypothetical protein